MLVRDNEGEVAGTRQGNQPFVHFRDSRNEIATHVGLALSRFRKQYAKLADRG